MDTDSTHEEDRRQNRIQRRRERDRQRWAEETAEQREVRLSRRRERDRAWRQQLRDSCWETGEAGASTKNDSLR